MINAEQDTIYNNVERLLYKYNHYKARIKSLEKKDRRFNGWIKL